MAKILDQGKFLYTVQEFVRSKGLFEKTVMTELLSIGQELRQKKFLSNGQELRYRKIRLIVK